MEPFTWGILMVACLIALQVVAVMGIEGMAQPSSNQPTKPHHHHTDVSQAEKDK